MTARDQGGTQGEAPATEGRDGGEVEALTRNRRPVVNRPHDPALTITLACIILLAVLLAVPARVWGWLP